MFRFCTKKRRKIRTLGNGLLQTSILIIRNSCERKLMLGTKEMKRDKEILTYFQIVAS